ncbi:LysR substrate-binding domain-containing protein [Pseudophaeobacter sp.]|uniref:LysR substrate-binding domain-containing protein n=1 Tax=Pseudophaeobacter sp. TaxID=1971739 RepID=UPI003296DB61
MQGRFRRIQHLLNALPVLEASVRLGSFTKAGEQLGLSQPTVSRHISNLEDHLGVPLFIRQHKKLTATRNARELARATDLGLSHIDSAVRKTMMEATAEGLRIACTQSFANCWLLPRFSDLRRASGDSQIHLLASHWLDDIDLDGVDMIIHWRQTGWACWPIQRLFDEVTFPVCAPDYLACNPSLQNCLSDPSRLSDFDLLHYEERPTEFVSWEDWLNNFGGAFSRQDAGYRFSDYQFMLRAAMDGEGVALAWQHLAADQIASGELVQVGPAYRRPDAGYFLEYRKDGANPDQLGRVLTWFRQATNSPAPV